jgi:quercetin dioxygenase-like cupin family protein
MVKIAKLIVCLGSLTPNWLFVQEIKVAPLLSRDLTEFPGKEGTMITVLYPPGGSESIHRHNAHVFVYLLQGSIVMQIRGGKEMILTAGQTFYESPNDVHVIGCNANKIDGLRLQRKRV